MNDLPIRLYGVIPVKVEDRNTRLNPELIMADELQPGKKVDISVREKNGKPMTYTIAMVEEGLLDLTNFKTPNPWAVFYAHEALGIKTWDMYDHVAGAYGGKLEQLLAIGGGLEGEANQIKSKDKKYVNRFKPVVKFLGPFTLNTGKTAKHSFVMPKYVGAVRTMLVAGNNGAYGATEKSTPVKQALMVMAKLPRTMGPAETVKLLVSLFVMDRSIRNVSLRIETDGLLKTSSKTVRAVQFTKPDEKIVSFEIKTQNAIGTGKVMILAKSGTHEASYDIELAVRNANPPVTKSYSKVLQAGESLTEVVKAIGIQGSNKLEIEVSSVPPINLGSRLKYLIRYPHGCVEQITSTVFPQLFLENIQELDQAVKEQINSNILTGIERLYSFQLPGGGFAYWPNSSSPDEWCTTYVGHFLIEAEKKGFFISPTVKNKWVGYQRKMANRWNDKTEQAYRYSDHLQAYRLYTLALADVPALSEMNRILEKSEISLQAKWRLATAYILAGKKRVASTILSGLTTDIPEYREMSNTFGSSVRDKAMILETMSLMKDQNKGIKLLQQISKSLKADKWMSTQTTAYALIAFAKFVGENNVSNQMNFFYRLDNKERYEVNRVNKMKQLVYGYKDKKEMSFILENKGDRLIYFTVINQGLPLAGQEISEENNIKINVKYKNEAGQSIDVSSLKQGIDFKAVVSIENPGQMGIYREMSLSQIFPSGWEIINTRLFGGKTDGNIPTYQDIRDDRVYTYFDIKPYETKEFVIFLNAAYLGEYYLPGILCEAMYDNRAC